MVDNDISSTLGNFTHSLFFSFLAVNTSSLLRLSWSCPDIMSAFNFLVLCAPVKSLIVWYFENLAHKCWRFCNVILISSSFYLLWISLMEYLRCQSMITHFLVATLKHTIITVLNWMYTCIACSWINGGTQHFLCLISFICYVECWSNCFVSFCRL